MTARDATARPWALLGDRSLRIVPEDQVGLSIGAASDPKIDRERYAQEIAVVQYDATPGDWRADFPHRRLNRKQAEADATFIVYAVNNIERLAANLAGARRLLKDALPLIGLPPSTTELGRALDARKARIRAFLARTQPDSEENGK